MKHKPTFLYCLSLILLLCLFATKLPAALKNNETLIFYHLPKNGGTSLTRMLDQQFAKQSICPDNFYYEIEKRSPANLRRFKFFRGHFFVHSNLATIENAKRITFLREPIERVLSEQRYFNENYRNNPAFFWRGHFLPPGEPIETMKNHQCRFLSSYDRNDPLITDAMHLASAKQNLKELFDFVGLTEEFEVCIRALYQFLGFSAPKTIPLLNVTDKQSLTITEAQLQAIRANNWADIELYAFARSLLSTY